MIPVKINNTGNNPMRYIVTGINSGSRYYDGHDIATAIFKAENSGFECTLWHMSYGEIIQTDCYSPFNGWHIVV